MSSEPERDAQGAGAMLTVACVGVKNNVPDFRAYGTSGEG
jgi:hypothetical protein